MRDLYYLIAYTPNDLKLVIGSTVAAYGCLGYYLLFGRSKF